LAALAIPLAIQAAESLFSLSTTLIPLLVNAFILLTNFSFQAKQYLRLMCAKPCQASPQSGIIARHAGKAS
jgi:hypothetical protein